MPHSPFLVCRSQVGWPTDSQLVAPTACMWPAPAMIVVSICSMLFMRCLIRLYSHLQAGSRGWGEPRWTAIWYV
jgi:hypothetical protein